MPFKIKYHQKCRAHNHARNTVQKSHLYVSIAKQNKHNIVNSGRKDPKGANNQRADHIAQRSIINWELDVRDNDSIFMTSKLLTKYWFLQLASCHIKHTLSHTCSNIECT